LPTGSNAYRIALSTRPDRFAAPIGLAERRLVLRRGSQCREINWTRRSQAATIIG
jgi:hypothetical protein